METLGDAISYNIHQDVLKQTTRGGGQVSGITTKWYLIIYKVKEWEGERKRRVGW